MFQKEWLTTKKINFLFLKKRYDIFNVFSLFIFYIVSFFSTSTICFQIFNFIYAKYRILPIRIDCRMVVVREVRKRKKKTWNNKWKLVFISIILFSFHNQYHSYWIDEIAIDAAACVLITIHLHCHYLPSSIIYTYFSNIQT